MKKQVVITGGNQGIGEALVKIFNDNDYQVISLDIDKPVQPFRGVIYEQVDIRDYDALLSIASKYENIDVLVNNAAKQYIAPLKEQDINNVKEMIDVNIMGTLNVTKAFLPKLNAGLIINIGSVHAENVRVNKIPYDMGKAALRMLTKELALELEKDQIRTLCVEFGAVKTPMNDNFENEEDLRKALDKQVIKHLLTSQECASMVFELTKEPFKYMDGNVIQLDCCRSLK